MDDTDMFTVKYDYWNRYECPGCGYRVCQGFDYARDTMVMQYTNMQDNESKLHSKFMNAQCPECGGQGFKGVQRCYAMEESEKWRCGKEIAE